MTKLLVSLKNFPGIDHDGTVTLADALALRDDFVLTGNAFVGPAPGEHDATHVRISPEQVVLIRDDYEVASDTGPDSELDPGGRTVLWRREDEGGNDDLHQLRVEDRQRRQDDESLERPRGA